MFTPWMPILSQGAAGPVAPYAIWVQPMSDYSPTGWQKCQWRFDSVAGEVEYRGLAKTTAAVASSNISIISCVMPATTTLVKPVSKMMAMGQTSHTPAVPRNSAVARLDIITAADPAHHTVNWELGNANAVGTGAWMHLNARWSLATTLLEDWSAWMPIQAFGYSGTETHARYATATVDTYNAPTWNRPEWRYRGTQVQIRGLFKTTAAQASGDPLLYFKFPSVLTPTRWVITPTMVAWSSTSGAQEFARLDLGPYAGGFQMRWQTAPWAPSAPYFWVDLNIDFTFFTSGG
jgi:hypothetical protein